MTEHTDKVNERRFQLFKERANLPSIEGRAEWNYLLKRYPNGKIVKVFNDKRKKDKILERGEEV
jgi:hypothetical protein